MSFIKIAVTIAALAGAAGSATPAAAGERKYPSGYESIDRASDAARYGVGRFYREGGRRICGYGCGRAAERGGRFIFDRSREGANRHGERLQDVGRHIGRRVRGR